MKRRNFLTALAALPVVAPAVCATLAEAPLPVPVVKQEVAFLFDVAQLRGYYQGESLKFMARSMVNAARILHPNAKPGQTLVLFDGRVNYEVKVISMPGGGTI